MFKQVVTTAKAPSSFLTLEKLAMKKTLIALAVLAASGASFAQSTVTISGYIGAGWQKDKAAVQGFAMTDSRIQLSGTEDLGGGLKASFTQQFRVNGGVRGTDDVVGEDSALSLAGGFGTVGYNKTRSSTLLTNALLSGASLADDQWGGPLTRKSIDVVSYTAPAMNGFTVGVARAESNGGDNHNHGTGGQGTIQTNIFSVSYAVGPLAAGVAMKKNAGALTTNKNEAFASYDLGMAKVALGYEKSGGDADSKTSAGVSVPMGAVTAGVNYISFGAKTYQDVAVSYALSKRTAVQFARGDYTDWASASTRIRVIHNF